jgi:hypothetical protein
VLKTIIGPATVHSERRTEQEWLDLEKVAKVEVTSEDPSFPLESALASGKGPGCHTADKGKQIIRIIFDKPRSLRRIQLEFAEKEIARTQEFTRRWAAESGELWGSSPTICARAYISGVCNCLRAEIPAAYSGAPCAEASLQRRWSVGAHIGAGRRLLGHALTDGAERDRTHRPE